MELKERIKGIYKERSDELHEGDAQDINAEELKTLREYIRSVVVDFIKYCNDNYSVFIDHSFKGMKTEYVKKLIARVEYLQANGYLDS